MASEDHSTLRTALVAGALAAAALVAAACRQGPDSERPPELEAVDVEPVLVIDVADDPTAVERPPALVGILPEDFPADLPLYLPASLVDFGTADDGWVYVNLLTPHAQTRVERELSALLAARGWSVAGGAVRQLRKGDARARLRIQDARPGTQYSFEYPG